MELTVQMITLLCASVCGITAVQMGYYEDSKEEDYSKGGKGKGEKFKGGRYYYGGKYTGKCGPDGLYYRDEYSFVLCSNAKGYVQPCAPGTRSSSQTGYAPGYYYGYSDFCDINLVDYGYSAPKYGPGYAKQPSFGFAAYRYPDDSGSYGNYAEQDRDEYRKPVPQGYKDGYKSDEYSRQPQGYGNKHNNGYERSQEQYDAYNSGKTRETVYQPQNRYSR